MKQKSVTKSDVATVTVSGLLLLTALLLGFAFARLFVMEIENVKLTPVELSYEDRLKRVEHTLANEP